MVREIFGEPKAVDKPTVGTWCARGNMTYELLVSLGILWSSIEQVCNDETVDTNEDYQCSNIEGIFF